MKKHSFPRKRNGFTLIELMITVAIIAILASIAYPSYQQYIVRSKRSAAQAQMMDIANRQQQFLLANRVYATKDALTASGYTLPAEVAANYGYTITLQDASTAVPSFLLTFSPTSTGSQRGDGDLTLDNQGVKTPAGKW
ncbi:type IV pilus assembly protein PilE [Variovorax paradoxus]|uniref:Type IV pilus assembly protein PilE n=1 Tax=Variovorax paradoxus TaxID=34073 RepID=A0AAE3Y5D7_VARPD|nr:MULTISPECIES: type IV pilin protein [Variovorax]MBD9665365.1 prepilin-type N-terminal cleavage/methylation domain-containing protein [Variovorax sp. VRV01]MDP9966954.1 type IV pilus assembly protein PilE [Variovorax paradoxus]MDR6429636.1 type IV pilus assembly protein PilE [Variovorax paradoxus]MDR6455689.1 type IV pilus assembly protein PilE [Variovorax paradoxus]